MKNMGRYHRTKKMNIGLCKPDGRSALKFSPESDGCISKEYIEEREASQPPLLRLKKVRRVPAISQDVAVEHVNDLMTYGKA